MGKRRYITFKVDEDLPDVAHLGSQGRAKEPLGVRCGRCLRFTGFCCVCTCTLFQALAPPMLAVMEVAVLLLLLLLLPHHDAASPFSLTTFSFSSSLEDLVAFSCIRGAVISGTYTVGSKRYQLRGYLVSAYVVGAAGLAYALVKAALFAYEPLAWLRPAALLITFAVFSWLHILAARHTVLWARRRGQLGLAPQAPFSSLPGLRHSSSAGSLSEWDGDDASDVAPELLADPDSQFVDLNGLVVHFKEATPPGPASPRVAQQQQQQQQEMPAADALASAAAWIAASAETARAGGGAEVAAAVPRDSAVVLVHGFGGGVFAWRHVMQALAAAVGARVISFDRPGFGLTARPEEVEPSAAAAAAAAAGSCPQRASSSSNSSRQRLQQPLLSDDVEQLQGQRAGGLDASPYSLEGQAVLTLQLCQALGLHRVVLAGHADGCLVALQAAALATRMHATASSSRQQQQHHRHHRGGRSSHAEAVIETAVSADFSWMGSLAETNGEPQQQQHASPAASSVSAGGAAAGGSGGGSRSQQGCGPSAGEGVHQQLREVQSMGEAGEEASPVSSISLQSMLQQGGGSSGSLQQQHSSSYTVVSSAGGSATTAEAASSKAFAGAMQQQQQQQQAGDGDWALQPPLLQPPMSGRQSELHAAAEDAAAAGLCVHVCGLVLLHPNLSGHQVPAFTRLLAASSLGRSMLRPLLRTEVGEVTHRRAWHNPELMTREVLSLYRRPLRVVAWDAALLAASRAAGAVSPRAVAAQLAAVRHLPCLLVTGEQDRIATPAKVAALSARLSAAQTAVVPSCGHFSHEEAPVQLLQALAPACAALLTRPVGC